MQASNLLKAGYSVTVWNRSASKCKPLLELGAEVYLHSCHHILYYFYSTAGYHVSSLIWYEFDHVRMCDMHTFLDSQSALVHVVCLCLVFLMLLVQADIWELHATSSMCITSALTHRQLAEF